MDMQTQTLAHIHPGSPSQLVIADHLLPLVEPVRMLMYVQIAIREPIQMDRIVQV